MRRYHRYRRYGQKRKLPPWAIVLIVVGSAVLLTVLIGNILGNVLNEETYQRLTAPKEESQIPSPAPANHRDINAYPFILGTRISGDSPMRVISTVLGYPDGTLSYTSDVSTLQGRTGNKSVTLSSALIDAGMIAPYISGVYSAPAIGEMTADVRYAVACSDGALLREFIRLGGNDVLLCDLPLENGNFDAILDYIRTVKQTIGTSSLGVSVPASLLGDPQKHILFETLLTACDFLALDARDVDSATSPAILLDSWRFYLNQYDMRLLMRENQPEWILGAEERLLPDFQIVPVSK